MVDRLQDLSEVVYNYVPLTVHQLQVEVHLLHHLEQVPVRTVLEQQSDVVGPLQLVVEPDHPRVRNVLQDADFDEHLMHFLEFLEFG